MAGAESTTFLAPASRCFLAKSLVKKTPEASIIYSAPTSFQLILAGSFSLVILIFSPLIIKLFSSCPISAFNLPWLESYLSRYARYSAGKRSFIATTLR